MTAMEMYWECREAEKRIGAFVDFLRFMSNRCSYGDPDDARMERVSRFWVAAALHAGAVDGTLPILEHIGARPMCSPEALN